MMDRHDCVSGEVPEVKGYIEGFNSREEEIVEGMDGIILELKSSVFLCTL
jgi:hypothetical protein